MDLAAQVEPGLRAEALLSLLLDGVQQLVRMGEELADGIGVGRVERQRDHRLDRVERDVHHAVVIRALLHLQRAVRLPAAVHGEVFLHARIRLPDGRKAGRLRGHHVDAVAEIHRQRGHARAGKLEHAVLDKAALKRRLHQRQRHIVRADAPLRRAGQVHEHDLRLRHVVGAAQQLLDQLRPALAHAHGAERAVARVAVGTEDHAAAGGHLLARVGMDDALVGRHIDAAVFLRRRKAERMVVLVDGAAHRAQAVVAVGHGVRQRELRQPAGARRLDDAHIGDVVRNQRVKAQPQQTAPARRVVRAQDAVRDRLFPAGAPLLRTPGAARRRSRRRAFA